MSADEQFGAFLEGEDGAIDEVDKSQLSHLRALLGDDIVWEQPPAGLEDVVVRDIKAASGSNVSSLANQRSKRSLGSRAVAFAAGIAAALAVVLGVGSLQSGGDYTVEIAGTDLAPNATGVVTIENTASGVSIELDLQGLLPSREGFYYQAWMKGEDGLVAVGTFHARGSGEDIVLWSGVLVDNYQTLTVTIQEEGAGPASSGEVVMIADITAP